MAESEFSYKPFASQGFYQVVNKQLVEMVDFHPGQRVVDLACGTGAVTRLILEKLRGARDSLVIGIDMSATAIREAMAQGGIQVEGTASKRVGSSSARSNQGNQSIVGEATLPESSRAGMARNEISLPVVVKRTEVIPGRRGGGSSSLMRALTVGTIGSVPCRYQK